MPRPRPCPSPFALSDACKTHEWQAILAASAAGGRKANNGDPEWKEVGIWKWAGDMQPTLEEILAVPEVKQLLATLEGGGGGFSNAGVLQPMHTRTRTRTCTPQRLGSR